MKQQIPRAFIDEVLARNDIVELINNFVPLKKRGQNYLACCPFHNEKTPSFTVSLNKQFYHCFGCGVSGNAISFLMEYDHQNFVEAVETLARQVGLEIPVSVQTTQEAKPQQNLYELLQQASHYYQQQLRQHLQAQKAVEYLKQRGLSGEIAKQFKIGFAPPGWDNLYKQFPVQIKNQLLETGMLIKNEQGRYYDRFRDRIMFPIHDRRGRVIGFGGRVLNNELPKYLNSPETTLFHKSKELYGLYETLQANNHPERILIVEGYMDVVALAQFDINYVVATLGTATSAQHLSQLFRHTPEVIFCFDGDTAGKKAAWSALETTLETLRPGVQARFMFLPEGEDPDSLIRQEGATVFAERIAKATPLSEFFFNHLFEKVNTHAADGKAQLINLASPLLNKIPDPAFQHLLLERLSKSVGIGEERLKTLIKTDTKAQTISQTKRQQPSTMRLAIALLLQNPKLANSLEDLALNQDCTIAGADVLLTIFELLKNNPKHTTGTLLEHWRDHDYFSALHELASWEHHVPSEGIDAELRDALALLRQQQQQQQITQLLQKANATELTPDEKQLLQRLIAEKKQSSFLRKQESRVKGTEQDDSLS